MHASQQSKNTNNGAWYQVGLEYLLIQHQGQKVILVNYVGPCLFQSSAQRAMTESKKMFDEMITSIERMRSEVTKLININEKAAFSQAEGLMERLEQEIDELKKKETGLKQLYSTDDHIHFLQVEWEQSHL